MALKEVYFHGIIFSALILEQTDNSSHAAEPSAEIVHRNGYIAHLVRVIQLFEPSFQVDFSDLVWHKARMAYGYFDYYINTISLDKCVDGIEISAYGQSGFHYESDGQDHLGISIRFPDGRLVYCNVESHEPFLQVRLQAKEIELVAEYVSQYLQA